MNYEAEIEDLSCLSHSEQFSKYFEYLKQLEEWTEKLLEREKILASAHSTLEFGINTLVKLLEQVLQFLETNTPHQEVIPIQQTPTAAPHQQIPTQIPNKLVLINNNTTTNIISYLHEE